MKNIFYASDDTKFVSSDPLQGTRVEAYPFKIENTQNLLHWLPHKSQIWLLKKTTGSKLPIGTRWAVYLAQPIDCVCAA